MGKSGGCPADLPTCGWLITEIFYDDRTVLLTHAEYDKEDWKK